MNPVKDGRPAPQTSSRTVEDPRVVEALQEYLAALEAGKTPNRQDLLRRHEAVATELAACLDALEVMHDVAPSLARRIPSSSSDDEASRSAVPLGDYRIIRELGRGGMGIVYEAEQVSLGRRVALKVLPFAAVLDSRQLQRFKNEAQAAAWSGLFQAS